MTLAIGLMIFAVIGNAIRLAIRAHYKAAIEDAERACEQAERNRQPPIPARRKD